MIIFDLDGVLCDTTHRKHFIDPEKNGIMDETICGYNRCTDGFLRRWQPDLAAYDNACDGDDPIKPTIEILRTLWIKEGEEIQIWSTRCESVRNKTLEWITSYVFGDYELCELKMRPIGNTRMDHLNISAAYLKAIWLGEALVEGKKIDFVFDADPDSIDMWHRRGVFCFDCRQDV